MSYLFFAMHNESQTPYISFRFTSFGLPTILLGTKGSERAWQTKNNQWKKQAWNIDDRR